MPYTQIKLLLDIFMQISFVTLEINPQIYQFLRTTNSIENINQENSKYPLYFKQKFSYKKNRKENIIAFKSLDAAKSVLNEMICRENNTFIGEFHKHVFN